MGLFYNNKTSKNKQLAYKVILPLLAILLVSLLSRGHFVCVPGFVKLTAFLTLPITLFFILPVYFDQHTKNEVAVFGLWKEIKYYFSAFILLYFMIWLMLCDVLPVTYTLITGDLINAKYEVTYRRTLRDGSYDDHWNSSGCRTKLWVRETSASYKSSVCPSKELWEQVAIGNIVNGKHKKSIFGFIIQELDGEKI
jgi:uncharacterized membrane protein (GlpM family)